MQDLSTEAEQDYIFERNIRLLKRALPIVFWLIAAFVIMGVIVLWQKNKAIKNAQEDMALLIEATQPKQEMTYSPELLLTLAKNGDYAGQLADLVLTSTVHGAKERLQTIASDEGFTRTIRNIAKLRYAGLVLNGPAKPTEREKAAEMLNSITKDQEFFYSASIYRVLLYLQDADKASAQNLFTQLNANSTLPFSVKRQLEAIATLLQD